MKDKEDKIGLAWKKQGKKTKYLSCKITLDRDYKKGEIIKFLGFPIKYTNKEVETWPDFRFHLPQVPEKDTEAVTEVKDEVTL